MKHNTFLLFTFILIIFSLKSFASGVVVLAGGGEDGKIGDKNAWSYELYKKLIENGDINGDKKIKVAVVSYYDPSDDETPRYFKSLGANTAIAVVAKSRKEANDPQIVNKLKDADVIFFRGGDQAEYYHLWKDTLLFKNLTAIKNRGGAFGGTSAGAMILAGLPLAGGQELGSKDTLSDGQSPLLDDQKGGSSIHDDFLNTVPNAIIETHYGERARLGRALGVHAKASEDYKKLDLLTIALSEQTGVVIKDGKAKVYGKGTVEFIQKTPESISIRKKGEPLVYTDLRNDVLVEGWTYDLDKRTPDLKSIPSTAKVNLPSKKCGHAKSPIEIDGSKKEDANKFEYFPSFGMENFKLNQSAEDKIKIHGVIGLTKANSYADDPSGKTERALIQAALYRSIYDAPGRTGILLSEESSLIINKNNLDLLTFEKLKFSKEAESASIILDCSECSYLDLSPRIPDLDNGSKTLHLPALVNLRIHVIGNSEKNHIGYNLKSHHIELLKPDECDDCSDKSKMGIVDLKKSIHKIEESIPVCV